MDHHADQPSWMTGTAAVGTGAGPPDLDAESEDSRDDGQAYARDNGVAEHGDAPGPAGVEPPGFGEAAPVFNDGPAQGFGGDPFGGNFGGQPDHGPGTPGPGPGPGGFGQAEGFGDGQPTFGDGQPAFGNGQPSFGNGQPAYGEPHAFGEPRDFGDGPNGFGEGQQATAFTDGFQGYGSKDSFEGPPDGGDTYVAPARDPYSNGAAGRDSFGPPYGGPGPAGAGYGGNGAGPGLRDNGPYTGQFQPVEPQGAKAKVAASLGASLKSVRRTKQPKDGQAGRQAQLTVARFEPWSVMKFSFVISVVAFIVLFVAVAVLWAALSGLGVFSTLQHSIQNITSSQGSSGFNLNTYLSASRVLGYTGLLGAINVVLITAICTVGSVLYNLAAGLVGGVEVTLKETD